jgi:rhamnosyltransferase
MMRKNITNASLPNKGNTCAIITVYLPDTDILHHIEKIKRQVHHIVVIINRCNQDTLNGLSRILSGSNTHSITTNTYNMGLAHALNQGIEIASSTNMEWMLLLDQDTAVDDDIIVELSKTISTMPIQPAILGANYRDIHGNSAAFQCRQKNGIYQNKPTVITSGSLLNMALAKHIGSFKSEYFIDSIDHEYCMRARSLGHQIYITCKPLMTHSIGLQEDTFLNRLQCLLSHPHSPERKYYIARNTIATAKDYIHIFPLWSIRQFLRILTELLSTIFFENKKRQRILFTVRGLIDGLKSNFTHGPLETEHVET